MQTQDSLRLKDLPIAAWLVGFVCLGAGIYFFSLQGLTTLPIVLGACGVLILLLTRGLTITADRNTRILQLHYWSLHIWRTTREIPFDEISNFRVNSTVSGTGTHRSRTYRVELIRKDGSVLPFRTTYTSGSFGKQKVVDRLRAFMGLGETFDESAPGVYRAARNVIAEAAAVHQEALTGPNEQERITNGVHWQLQSAALGAAMPVTRWYSPDFKTRGGFLFLGQKVSGQSTGGFLAALGKALFQQAISLYGFRASDTPNVSQAQMLPSISPLLDPHFTAFTNLGAEARQILNAWLQHPLADWAQRHPLKQFQAQGSTTQLVVLFNPDGVYLAMMGILQPEQVEELTALGVDLIRTQGAVHTA